MTEVLNFFQELREGFPFLFEYVANSITIFIVALSVVYLTGRMFGILKRQTSKNVLAFLVIAGGSWILTYMKYEFDIPIENKFFYFVFDIILYASGSILLYTLIGFSLYSRMDTLLDKKFGRDKPQRKKTSGKKKS